MNFDKLKIFTAATLMAIFGNAKGQGATTENAPKTTIAVGADISNLSHSYKNGGNSIVTWRDCVMPGVTAKISQKSNDITRGIDIRVSKSISGSKTDDDATVPIFYDDENKTDVGCISFHNINAIAIDIDAYKKSAKKPIYKTLGVSFQKFDDTDIKLVYVAEKVLYNPVYTDDASRCASYVLMHIRPHWAIDFEIFNNKKSSLALNGAAGPSPYLVFTNWRGRNRKQVLIGLDVGAKLELNYTYRLNSKNSLTAKFAMQTDQGAYSGVGFGYEENNTYTGWTRSSRKRTETNKIIFSLFYTFGR